MTDPEQLAAALERLAEAGDPPGLHGVHRRLVDGRPAQGDGAMTDPVEVERVARAAVALCADLLRRYRRDLPSVPLVHPEAMTEARHAELGHRVLAWQDQLDTPPTPVPPLAAAQPHIVDWDGETREVTCTGCGVDVRYDHGPCPGKPAEPGLTNVT